MELSKIDGVKDKNDKLQEVDTVLVEEGNNYYSDVFTPGETKEQLRIGREVAGNAGGNFKIVVYNHTSTALGNYSFTGAGFKPKKVKIFATRNQYGSGARYVIGSGMYNGVTQFAECTFQAEGSQTLSHDVSTSYTILAYNSLQEDYKRATFVSFDNDGFTVNFTRSLGGMYFVVEYYG